MRRGQKRRKWKKKKGIRFCEYKKGILFHSNLFRGGEKMYTSIVTYVMHD
jgi:hypothetical protein